MKKLVKSLKDVLSSKDKLFILIIDILFVVSVFTFFLFTSNKYFILTWIFFSLFAGLLFLRLFLKEGLKIDIIVILSFILIISMLISYILSGFASFNSTNVVLIILFNVFYQYFIFTNNFNKVLRLIYTSFLIFLVSFLALYYKEIFSGSVDRIGGEVANVNMVGFFFTVGFIFAIYYSVFKRKYYEIIIAVVFLALALLTGSKKVIVNIVIIIVLTLIIFFGKKKWYFSLGTIIVFTALFFLVLSIPPFETIKNRFLMFLNQLISGAGKDFSTILRAYAIEEALVLFLKRPLFGWGFYGYERVGALNMYSHNNLTEILTNFGVIAFSIYEFLLIGPVIKSAFQLKKEKKDNVFIILLGSVLFVSQFGMVIIDSKDIYLYLALINAYFYKAASDNNLNITYRIFQRRKEVVSNE